MAAVHAEAATPAARDWAEVVGVCDVLLRVEPSPVAALNRAAAVAMRDGSEAGLALIDAILARGELAWYHQAHSARGELLRQLGWRDEAIAAYRRVLELAAQDPGRRLLEKRLHSI